MRIYKTRHGDLATQVNVARIHLSHNALSLNDVLNGASGGVDNDRNVLFELL